MLSSLCSCSRMTTNWVEKTTNVNLPTKRTKQDLFDNGETYVVGHFAVPVRNVREWIKEYKFVGDSPIKLSDVPRLASLKPENQTEPKGFKPYYLNGHSKSNSWLFIADANSGRVWYIVEYPDMGGDSPGPIILGHEQIEFLEEFETK